MKLPCWLCAFPLWLCTKETGYLYPTHIQEGLEHIQLSRAHMPACHNRQEGYSKQVVLLTMRFHGSFVLVGLGPLPKPPSSDPSNKQSQN